MSVDTLMTIERDRKQAVQAAFARAAGTYDAHVDVQRDVAAGLLRRLSAGSAPSHILEIGCGTGNLTQGLADAWPEAEILAIDFCPEMLAVARRKLAGRSGVSFEATDGERYVAEEGRFDLITSSAAFQWFDDLPLAASRFARMLAPAGRLAFAMFGPGTFRELTKVLAQQWPEAVPAAASFLEADVLRTLMAAQFGKLEIAEENYRREYPSLLDLLRKIQHTGTGAGQWQGMLSPSRLRRIEAAYRAAEGGIVASYQVYFCEARRRALA